MTRGYTLLEILVAVTLMLIIMLGLTQLFSSVGTQINNTQATLQIAGELRSVKNRLESDLKMVTADLSKAPPMKTGLNQGYFCIIEGMGAAHTNALLLSQNQVTGKDIAYTSDSKDDYDNTVGDMDDILMFTAHAPVGQPFRGLVGGQVRESNMAEIIWFCRGNTLYRRTLLILPDLEFQAILRSQSVPDSVKRGLGFYQNNDVSVRINPDTGFVVANSLEDLAQRQNRFGHAVSTRWTNAAATDPSATFSRIQQAFPFNIYKNSAAYYLRMPTVLETSHPNWDASQSFVWNLANCGRSVNAYPSPNDPNPSGLTLAYDDVYGLFPNAMTSATLPDTAGKPFIDYWEHPFPWTPIDLTGTRYAEDVISTNVISFDIQVWDGDAGRWVNLGEANKLIGGVLCYDDGVPAGPLGKQGNYPLLGGNNFVALPCTYDTWTEEFEREGHEWPNQNGTLTKTEGRDQISDFGTGVIGHKSGWTTPPPYDVPLRGIKVTIRTFDPLSRNVREMTVVHNFVGR